MLVFDYRVEICLKLLKAFIAPFLDHLETVQLCF